MDPTTAIALRRRALTRKPREWAVVAAAMIKALGVEP
jgi:hypothetical protein